VWFVFRPLPLLSKGRCLLATRLKVKRRRRTITRANNRPLQNLPVLTEAAGSASLATLVFDRPVNVDVAGSFTGVTIASRTVLSAAWAADQPANVQLTMSGSITNGDPLTFPASNRLISAQSSGAYWPGVTAFPVAV
jgi:hypothetical protein